MKVIMTKKYTRSTKTRRISNKSVLPDIKSRMTTNRSGKSGKSDVSGLDVEDLEEEYVSYPSISRRRTKFFSQTKIAKRVKREPLIKNKIQELLDDNIKYLIQHHSLNRKQISQKGFYNLIYNDNLRNCICDNIFKQNTTLDESCKCDNISSKQIKITRKNARGDTSRITRGITNKINIFKSSKIAPNKIHSIECHDTINYDGSQNNILDISKVSPYIKLKSSRNTKDPEMNKYYFIECDSLTHELIMNSYFREELPFNTVNIRNSGICHKGLSNWGYKLKTFNQISGKQFLEGVMNYVINRPSSLHPKDSQDSEMHKHKKQLPLREHLESRLELDDLLASLNIITEDRRYLVIANMLLQIVLVLGHLQTSPLDFYHGNYILENILITKLDKSETKYFDFTVNNRHIKVKNLGFAARIGMGCDYSSIAIESARYSNPGPSSDSQLRNTYRIVSSKVDSKFTSKYWDMYLMMISILSIPTILPYLKSRRLDETIMGFIPDNILQFMINNAAKGKSQVSSKVRKMIEKYKKEHTVFTNFNNVFNTRYLETLNNLNYRLFREYL